MNQNITRRDFLNGTALVITGLATGALTACDDAPSQPQNHTKANLTTPTSHNPPQLTGLRGNHEGSYDVAHEMAWKKANFDVSGEAVLQTVDLVVVGAGLSGLASAYFYQKKFPNTKILILDNHDDFGGHAKRVEFHANVDGKDVFYITYGGSESIDTPSEYSDEAMGLLTDLGIDVQKFYAYFDQKFYDNAQLVHGTFFNKNTFGKSTLIADQPNATNAQAFFAQAPLSEADKQALTDIYTNPKDYLGDMPKDKRMDFLKTISYDTFLKEYAKLPASAVLYLSDICLEYWGFNIDGLSAFDAFYDGYVGFDNLDLPSDDSDSEGEPYIFHFPDGNASIARLLVKKMIPNVVLNPEHAQGKSDMESIVLDKFDYDALDKDDQAVKIRLSATAVQVKNIEKDGKKGVVVGYKKDGKLYRVDATHCILACQHGMISHLDSDLPQAQKDDFLQNVKVPMIYTKVFVKDWHAFKKLGVYKVSSPNSPYCLVRLDYPVSMGGYHYPTDPSQPIVIHMARVLVPYGTGQDVRQACKIGRSELYRASYHDLEKQALDQLREIYDLAGETLDDKLLGITINRWGHGYSYERNRLFDKDEIADKILSHVKRPHGQIHLANSDADWMPYADGAIDQAWRAVSEIST